MPALLTRMSMPPSAAVAALRQLLGAVGGGKIGRQNVAAGADVGGQRLQRGRRGCRTDRRWRRAPPAPVAIAAPIAPEAPVTSARFPARSNIPDPPPGIDLYQQPRSAGRWPSRHATWPITSGGGSQTCERPTVKRRQVRVGRIAALRATCCCAGRCRSPGEQPARTPRPEPSGAGSGLRSAPCRGLKGASPPCRDGPAMPTVRVG